MLRTNVVKISLSFVLLLNGLMPGGQHIVTQVNKEFAPGSITINRGETIIFKNNDQVTHNAFSTAPGNAFNLKAQQPGGEASATFNNPGVVEVRCAIHPKMRLIVNVK